MRPALDARRQAEARGRRAERLAEWWLRLQGWRVLARRHRARGGEIDLVMRRFGVVAFVEVKARADIDGAAEAAARGGFRRIAAAAEDWLARHPQAGPRGARFDAVLVAPGRWPKHLKDVYQASP